MFAYPPGKYQAPQSLLSLKERDRRWKVIREEMKKRNLDCLMVFGTSAFYGSMGVANVRYITNGDNYESWAVFPIEGEPTHFSWARANLQHLRTMTWVNDVRGTGSGYPIVLSERVKELGFDEGNIGLVGLSDYCHVEGWISHNAYVHIQKLLPKASLIDATTMLTDIRMIKSDEELKFIEKAAEIGDIGIEAMARTAQRGVRENEVQAAIINAFLMNDCEHPTMVLIASGQDINSAQTTASHRLLRTGDMILTEMYPRYAGYYAHPNQAIALDPIHKDYEDCIEAVLESHKECLKVLKPGKTWQEVNDACEKPILERGMYYHHPHIHGLGLDQPDSPATKLDGGLSYDDKFRQLPSDEEKANFLSNRKNQEKFFREFKVKANMALAIQTMAVIGKGDPNDRGVHFGPSVIITETGPKILSKYAGDVIRI